MRRRPIVLAVAASLALAAALVVPAVAQKEQPAPRAERRFAHAAHATALAGKGKPAEACAGRCHRSAASGEWMQQGKTEHARCFESCHTFETSCSNLAAGSGKVCLTCHVNLKAACVPASAPRLAGRPPELGAAYSHKKHIRPGATTGQQCEGCHGSFGAAATPRAVAVGHRQCAGCHEKGLEPFMTQCQGCHVGATPGAPVAKPASVYAVTGAFDHARHAAAERVGTAGRACLACHANIAQATSDSALPMPTMQGCYQSCHDGKKAFSATGATCTRCHQGGRR
jgi:hypothetical protein